MYWYLTTQRHFFERNSCFQAVMLFLVAFILAAAFPYSRMERCLEHSALWTRIQEGCICLSFCWALCRFPSWPSVNMVSIPLLQMQILPAIYPALSVLSAASQLLHWALQVFRRPLQYKESGPQAVTAMTVSPSLRVVPGTAKQLRVGVFMC